MQQTTTSYSESLALSFSKFPQLDFLKGFVEKLLGCKTPEEKLALLDSQGKVSFFFLQRPQLYQYAKAATIEENIILKSLIIIDQAEHIFSFDDASFSSFAKKLTDLFVNLQEVETFYSNIGGIIGYHVLCLELIAGKQQELKEPFATTYLPPAGIDLTKKNAHMHHLVAQGIRAQKSLAELYPVGGAADRLNLQDEKTHKDLPAARLEFLGRSLLEGMVRDVQAREFLYFKLLGEQISIPIGLMTSLEKNNDMLISQIISQHQYFGKDQDSFKLFTQPLVPTLTLEGVWVLKGPLELLLKPGGHGAIWKLAYDKGVFAWMQALNKDKILVRQINNPIASIDLGLTAFVGVGASTSKAFGFASCKRRANTSEGMNIIKVVTKEHKKCVTLSSVEYCDFEKFGIEDVPASADQPYSLFPSNTNILYADIAAACQALVQNPYPGKVINFKKVNIGDSEEELGNISIARLELLMQNLADAFAVESSGDLEVDNLPVFITFNERHKTISPTKKQFVPGSGLVETAYGCFYDFLKNAKDLLNNYCSFTTPELTSEEKFLHSGPSFMLNYHPALGPLYSVIGQKIQQGKLCFGAELYLEIADVYFNQLTVDGSLIVDAKQVLGHTQEKKLCFSHLTGRCFLKNVTVKNKGVNRLANNIYWKNKIEREETCYIQLQGYSEFIAENVVLEGDYHVIVRDGERVTAIQQGDDVIFRKEYLDKKQALPFWKYSFGENEEIILEK